MFAGSREAVRIVYRDPEHVSERLTLYAIARLAEPSVQWAESVRSSRAGTPLLIALVPGYLTYLYQEMRMTLRTAALYGRDPLQLQTAGEMLALRGVHPDIEHAEAALTA